MKTILQSDGELYHKVCLTDMDKVEIETAKVVEPGDVEDGQICEMCNEPLVGDAAPEDAEEVEGP